MVFILKENERIDDLQIKDFKIIQNADGFCFGMDSVILSEFAKNIKKDSKVLDLGTGTGIISFLLLAKCDLKHVLGVEIQEEVADMVSRSIQLNKLEDKFEVLNCDIKQLENKIEKNSFDVVVTNPPYKKINTGGINPNTKKMISRHEVYANIFDFIKVSKMALKDKGVLYMVHRPERLSDIILALKENKIQPKIIKFVYSNKESNEAKLILIKAIKNGGDFLKVEKPLYIYNENNNYSKEIMDIYNL